MRLLNRIFLCLLLGTQLKGFSQQVTVSLNRNNILIGEQINLAIKIPVSDPAAVANFNVPDSIPHFEIISSSNPERLGGTTAFIQKAIVFTSFDSGAYSFPSIKIDLNESGKLSQLYSPAIVITVGYSKEDSPGLHDLKPLRMVKADSNLWIYILAGILTIIILYFLIRSLIKNNRRSKVSNNSVDYFGDAIKELDELEKSNLESKQFHSKLGLIFRKYYSNKSGENLLVQTTGEVLVQLKVNKISDEIIEDVASSLRFGDAVKYAKYRSLKEDDLKILNVLRKVVEKMNKIN